MTDEEMDEVFQALAHATRRRILDLVKARPGQGVGEVAAAFEVSRIAVMNHLAVLEQAGLIISQRSGRTRRLYLNAAPIQLIRDRWISAFEAPWAERVATLKRTAEAAARLKGEEQS